MDLEAKVDALTAHVANLESMLATCQQSMLSFVTPISLGNNDIKLMIFIRKKDEHYIIFNNRDHNNIDET